MKYIDLYDIHDAAFANRAECSSCEWHRGEGLDAVCLKLDDMEHHDCPFVSAVLSDAEAIIGCENKDMIIEFADKIMELELDKREKESISVGAFSLFVSQNQEILKPKITDFFTSRLRDDNNYRSVIYV